MLDRLASQHPQHAAALNALPPSSRQSVAERIALRAAELNNVAVTGLSALQLGDLAVRLDEDAWSGTDPDEAAQDPTTFAQARAANALHLARSPWPAADSSADSIYESIHAIGDQEVLAILLDELKT